MNFIKHSYFFLIIILLFSCAEQIPPNGGKKDITAPIPKKIKPENYTTNFHFNTIEITFDEFIKLNKGSNNITISPIIDKKPKIELLGKKIRITFQEILSNNTTYIINFGNSIKDYNEGNELKNFKYVFSTGKFIDSIKVSGQVFDAFDNKPLKNIIVGLYPDDEDSILHKKPLYFTKTNNEGKYIIDNIKIANYKIAAINDKNLNYIFDQGSEKISFSPKVLKLNKSNSNQNFYLFTNIKETQIINTNNEENNHIIFNFNKPFLDLNIDISNYNENEIIYYSLDKKQLHYWYLNKDSIKTQFIIQANNKNIDTFNLKLKENKIKNKLSFDIISSISEEKNLILLNFKIPITKFNIDKTNLFYKKTKISYKTKWLNNNKTLEIKTNKLFDTLILKTNKESFISFNNKFSQNKTDTIYKDKNSISNLIITLKEKDNLIIELYNSNSVLVKSKNVSRETKVIFSNLIKGNYNIRVYEDINNDAIWNTGNLNKKIVAEKTLFYKTIKIKENWDKEIELKF